MSLREIILDTETTGLDPNAGHRIVEIGALEMVNKSLTGKKFHSYINPRRDMPEEAYRIHGISAEFLEGKPTFKKISEIFLRFIEDARLVIHNAPFDIKFLNYELSLINQPSLELSEVIDTLVLAKQAYPGSRVNLDSLCRKLKIDNSARKLHGALLDASILAEVYVELTGGRQTSFKINNSIKADDTKDMLIKTRALGNQLRILPTQNELADHRHFIKSLIKKM